MILKEQFFQDYANDEPCRKINEWLSKRPRVTHHDIMSIESERLEADKEFPRVVTVWYWD